MSQQHSHVLGQSNSRYNIHIWRETNLLAPHPTAIYCPNVANRLYVVKLIQGVERGKLAPFGFTSTL